MARTIEQIEDDIRSLDASERDRLMRDLVADLDGNDENDIGGAWLTEAQHRHEELRSGAVEAVPAEEVFRRVRARLTNEQKRGQAQ